MCVCFWLLNCHLNFVSASLVLLLLVGVELAETCAVSFFLLAFICVKKVAVNFSDEYKRA